MHFADTVNERAADGFNGSWARQIKEFVETLPEQLDTLFVCCDSGESRSTAMAAAILRYQDMDEWVVWENPHYHPNPLVYRRLCEALEVPVSEDEVCRRLECSEKALENAIKASRRRAR